MEEKVMEVAVEDIMLVFQIRKLVTLQMHVVVAAQAI
jgi:hypothetical protein